MASGRPQTPFRLSSPESDMALDQQVVEQYLARIEETLEARVEELVEERTKELAPLHSPARDYTGRIAASLALGIPLTAVAGGVASHGGGSGAGMGAIIAVVSVIFGLNVFYTAAEIITYAIEAGTRRHRRP
ncbi:MAG TPA: hypothetical protein VFA70_03095 [Dehalococcoidia bacterium]|jgi:hypothetical protein|nr:hypothetical protein [Dehalococcoidia bacterium]